MKKEEFCDIIGEMDEKYVSEALLPEKTAKKSWKKWVAAAACACIVLGTTTVFATTDFGIRLIEKFTGRTEGDYTESGYTLDAEVKKFPMSSFSWNTWKIKADIIRQYREYEWHDSWFPGHWQKNFDTAAEAKKYIGFDGLILPQWGIEETGAVIDAHGSRSGEIWLIGAKTEYREGDIRIYIWADIYTEHHKEKVTTGSFTTQNIEFTEREFTTENGLRCLEIRSSPMESGYMSIDGYIVKDGVLYKGYFSFTAEDSARAEELFYQWADMY